MTGSGTPPTPQSHSEQRQGAPLLLAMRSWRTASVSLLSFASGMPLGLVWIAIPDWLRSTGLDIRYVGLITLAQAPWTFKILWSPFLDRYSPPFFGRRRGWIALSQVALFALMLMLAGVGHRPETPWVVGALALAIAFASATQDIAYDAYVVDVLKPEEQGVAVGAKTAMYRAAMYAAGGLSITLAGLWSWPAVNVLFGLLYLPMLLITWKAPEPSDAARAPRTMREAIWHPFLGFLGRHRALEILAFVFFYKFADNLALALLRPFLVDRGYSDFDRGVALVTVGVFTSVIGALMGGMLTTSMGLGHSLWLFGFLQIFSNIGYVFVARSAPDRLLMYGAVGIDNLATGLGTGAFSVLLLRITQKRFSATQYAMFSSLFGLPRVLTGPISGFMVDAMGWEAFFWSTLLAGIPGLVLLGRFVPLGQRDPHFIVEKPHERRRLGTAGLLARGLAGGAIALVLSGLLVAAMGALKSSRSAQTSGFDLLAQIQVMLAPSDMSGWLQAGALLSFAAIVGLATAAVFAARHGAAAEMADAGPEGLS